MTRVQTLSLAIGVALAALAVGWMAGRATNDSPTVGTSVDAAATERKVLYYRNPMGLPDTSPVPKKDPMGMDYVPVYADDAPPAAPGTVVLPPDQVQALGAVPGATLPWRVMARCLLKRPSSPACAASRSFTTLESGMRSPVVVERT